MDFAKSAAKNIDDRSTKKRAPDAPPHASRSKPLVSQDSAADAKINIAQIVNPRAADIEFRAGDFDRVMLAAILASDGVSHILGDAFQFSVVDLLKPQPAADPSLFLRCKTT